MKYKHTWERTRFQQQTTEKQHKHRDIGSTRSNQGDCSTRWILPREITLHSLTSHGVAKSQYFRFNFSSTHSDRCQQPLRHVGNDDANEEDDGLQPGVSKDQRQDEESHTEEDGHARDDVDEVLNLLGYGCLRRNARISTTSSLTNGLIDTVHLVCWSWVKSFHGIVHYSSPGFSSHNKRPNKEWKMKYNTLPVSRPEVNVAMRPMTVRSPVHTTMPRAVPEKTEVRKNTSTWGDLVTKRKGFTTKFGLTLNAVGGEEGNVAGLQRVVMGAVRWPGLGLRFTSQWWVVHLNTAIKKKN